MSANIFPQDPMMGWSFIKRPLWLTKVKRSVSGVEYRSKVWGSLLWEFECNYNALTPLQIQTFLGFYNLCCGSWDTFYFMDPTHKVVGQALGIGTGALNSFQLSRDWQGMYIEYPTFPVSTDHGYGVDGVQDFGAGYGIPFWSPPYIYLDGVEQSAGYAITQAGVLSFTNPPGSGVVVTATFDFYYTCRFKEDSLDAELFNLNIWSGKSIKLVTVR
jgi:hypothetical protein